MGILASMAIGCTGHKVNADGNVAVEFNNTINPLAENISSIELIPLETDSEHLVGGVTDLTIAGGFLYRDGSDQQQHIPLFR